MGVGAVQGGPRGARRVVEHGGVGELVEGEEPGVLVNEPNAVGRVDDGVDQRLLHLIDEYKVTNTHMVPLFVPERLTLLRGAPPGFERAEFARIRRRIVGGHGAALGVMAPRRAPVDPAAYRRSRSPCVISMYVPSGSVSHNSCSGVPRHVVRGGFSTRAPKRTARARSQRVG